MDRVCLTTGDGYTWVNVGNVIGLLKYVILATQMWNPHHCSVYTLAI